MKILLDKAPPASTLTASHSSSSRQADSDLSPDDAFSFLIAETQGEDAAVDDVDNEQDNIKQEAHAEEANQQTFLPESMMQLLSVKLNIQNNKKDGTSDLNNSNDMNELQRKMLGLDSDAAKKILESIADKKDSALQAGVNLKDLTDNNNKQSGIELSQSNTYDNLHKTYANTTMQNKGIDLSGLQLTEKPETLASKMQIAELAINKDQTINKDSFLTTGIINSTAKTINKLRDSKSLNQPVVSQVVDRSVDFVNLVNQYRQQNSMQFADLKGNNYSQNNLMAFADKAGVKTDHFTDASIEMNEPTSVDLDKMTYHVRLKIYPPDLGKISASLKLDNNRADLFFTAENERVSQILKQHLPELKDQLNAAMIKVDMINVHISSNNEQLGEKDGKNNPQQLPEMSYQEDRIVKTSQKQVVEKKENKSDSMIDAYI